jgi:RHS repeat-associated protein
MNFRFIRHIRMTAGLVGALLLADPVAAGSLCGSSGDGNGDCRISLSDHADFAQCMTGPATPASPECDCFDMNGDGTIDLADAQLLHQDFTGDSLIAGCVLPVREDEPGTLRPQKAGSPNVAQPAIPDSTVSDSVYLFSGEFHLTATDMVIRGRGFDFEWTRRYRSKIGPDTSMGSGWDHSYNIRLEQSGGNLVLHDGDGRSDEYCPTSKGTFMHPEFFRELVPQGNGFSLVLQDRTAWNFNGFSGLPDDGKVSSMTDRTGNRMTFEYDPATGRLTGIRDTLDSPINARLISIAYNADGLIQSVTDFTGRQVTYEYYQDPEIGGDAGDLKSMTTPPVVGTPNGNDFPLGKTTVYTYSEGLADPRLNHNLLTVTDPKGQTFVVNTYAPTLNPADLEYDRVVSQQFGNPTDLMTFSYETVTPTQANNFSTITCYINDRVGNVEECSYDYRNRLALKRRYTGRANPLLPTTAVLNRPVNPLRPTDPPLFETRYEYNDESLLTRVLSPELNEERFVYESDIDYFAPPRTRSNVRERRSLPGPRGAAQPELVEGFEYDSSINFDTNQVTRCVDARGNQTQYSYDAIGNRTQTIHPIPSVVEDFEYNAFGQLTLHRHPDNGSGSRREDQYTYYPQGFGPQGGYLESEIIDNTGFSLATSYEYDSVGNVTRTIDSKGNDTQHTYNQLDQIVRSLSREVVPAAGPRYENLYYYDENDNVVRIDTENRDANGLLNPNTHFTTIYEYDNLNYLTRTTEEVDPVNDIVIEYEYDANRNQTLVRSGEATNGAQPSNTETRRYDERDLLFHETRAAGDPNESTDQYDYDANGIITLYGQGLQGIAPREDTFEYDGYNRLTIKGTSFGNRSSFEYDENHNVVREVKEGELFDKPGSASNVRLGEDTYGYDPLNRLTIQGQKFFDSAQNPLTDGESTTQYVYSDASQVIEIVDDNSQSYSCIYDSANRRSVCTDAKGNSVRYTYDANSNIIAEESTEKSDLGSPDQLFTDTYSYDGLNRLTLRGDNFGNSSTRLYDSRDLLTSEDDALGNTTTYAYDGMKRLTGTNRILTNTGDGSGVVIGVIANTQVWDDSSRLVLQADGNGNATTYVYDALDRLTLTGYADGTSEFYQYDVRDNKTLHVDANGTQIDYTYDLEDRLTDKVITAGPGVSPDTTFEKFTYDGLDRLVLAEDDDSLVAREYDSLSNAVSETQNGLLINSQYDGIGNESQCVYPNGRTIDRLYDGLNRVIGTSDSSGPISNFSYVGPDRLEFRSLSNGTTTLIIYDGITGVPNRPGDFGVKRPASIFHENPGAGAIIDARDLRWDPQYNKKNRIDHTSQFEHAYEYDSVYRLTRTVETDVSVPVLVRDTQYQLDNVGNRNFVANDNCPGVYTSDVASPPADFQTNQYTSTGCDARTYDENGNLTQRASGAPPRLMTYDYKDRLITHDDVSSGLLTTMVYDALGRRIRKKEDTAISSTQTDYFYDGNEVIYELDGVGTETTYVYGGDIDEVVQMVRGGSDYYYHSDDMGNVMALTDSNGMVVERYEYQDYGQPEFFDGAGLPIGASAIENPYLFTGRRFDSSTEMYYYRNRYLDPISGRFISRDPLGMWYDDVNHGNAYSYAGSNPWTNSDPFGLMNKAELIDAMAKGVALSGSSASSVSKRAARIGRNPQTGKEIKIAAKNVVKFKAGSELSKKVNAAPGGGSGCPMETPYPCPDGSCASSADSCPNEVPPAVASTRHRGHVTVLKASEGSSGGDYNSSRSNKSSGITLGGGGGSGGGGGGCGMETAALKGGHSGHVTVLKLAGQGNPGHVTVLKLAGSSHPGHVTVLKLAGRGNPGHVTVLKLAGSSHPGHVTVLKLAGRGNPGHVTVLKLAGSSHRGHVTVLK